MRTSEAGSLLSCKITLLKLKRDPTSAKLLKCVSPISKNYMAKKILFIEDEAAAQKALGDVLRREGYEVFSALDGQVGLQLARTKKPDLILLDLILPKMDGFEVLGSLKKEPATKEIPIIILTNLERMEDVEKALELGAKTYLTKANYSVDEVVEKVRKALEEGPLT